MIADKNDGKKWYGNDSKTAKQTGNPSNGMATESQGREESPDMYLDDVVGKVARRNENSIWKRGKMKRIKHKMDDE